MYEYDWTNWNQVGQNLNGDSDGDAFGSSVSLSTDGNVLAVGAEGSLQGRGSVQMYQYVKIEDKWEMFGQSLIGDPSEAFGTSISLSSDGKLLVVGSNQCVGEGGSGRGGMKAFRYGEELEW